MHVPSLHLEGTQLKGCGMLSPRHRKCSLSSLYVYMLIFDMIGISNDPRLLCRWGGKRRLRWYNHNHLRQWASSISVTCYREVGWFTLWFISQKKTPHLSCLTLTWNWPSFTYCYILGPPPNDRELSGRILVPRSFIDGVGMRLNGKIGRYRKLPSMYPPNTSAVCIQVIILTNRLVY